MVSAIPDRLPRRHPVPAPSVAPARCRRSPSASPRPRPSPALLDDLMIQGPGRPQRAGASGRRVRTNGGFVDSDGSPVRRPGSPVGWWPVGRAPTPVGALSLRPDAHRRHRPRRHRSPPRSRWRSTNRQPRRRPPFGRSTASTRRPTRSGPPDAASSWPPTPSAAASLAICTTVRSSASCSLGLEVQRIGRRAEDPDVRADRSPTRVSEQIRSLLDELRALVHGHHADDLAGARPGGRQSPPSPIRCRCRCAVRGRRAARSDGRRGRVDRLLRHRGGIRPTPSNTLRRNRSRSTLAAKDGRLEIIVTDDGKGLAEQPTPGFGLRSLQDRVAALDGTITAPAGPQPRSDVCGRSSHAADHRRGRRPAP